MLPASTDGSPGEVVNEEEELTGTRVTAAKCRRAWLVVAGQRQGGPCEIRTPSCCSDELSS